MLVSSEDCFVLSSPYHIKKMRPVSLRTGGLRKSCLSFQFKVAVTSVAEFCEWWVKKASLVNVRCCNVSFNEDTISAILFIPLDFFELLMKFIKLKHRV